MVKAVLEIIVGDILFAIVVSGVMAYINNRNQKTAERELEKQINHLKELIKLEFERFGK